MRLSLNFILAATASSSWLATTTQAALPPGATEAMLANASDVALIYVEDADAVVGANATSTGCLMDFDIHARVLQVNQTSTGLTGGGDVNFPSYILNDTIPGCEGFVGPLPPPMLSPGWCGYIYLDDVDGSLELAAYGHSFVPAPDNEHCQEIDVHDDGDDHDDDEEGGEDHGGDMDEHMDTDHADGEHGEEMTEEDDHGDDHGHEEGEDHGDEEKEDDHGEEEGDDHGHAHGDGEDEHGDEEVVSVERAENGGAPAQLESASTTTKTATAAVAGAILGLLL